MKLDEVDIKILKELVADSSQSVKEIAGKVNLSVTPVHDRIKKMKESGIIKNYTAVLDVEKLGYNLVAYLQVKLIKHREEIFDEFKARVLQFDEVIEAAFTIGDYDVMLKLLLKDMHHYEDFVLKKISKLDVIYTIKSSFSFKFMTDNRHLIDKHHIS
ncbi:Lrp/AsnC family transcriptional regulator [Riemerella columbina]|uniref:Lrp/AsnC family transcriptional regulator n=1 Tax=Riemerella columbina TaxID=103810 RepID=UPI00036D429F|nr:Lrp/AsnC family transcriptional regulator [Riemerella columbina]